MHKARASPSQTKPIRNERRAQGSTFDEQLLASDSCWDRKRWFLKRVAPAIFTTLQWMATYPRICSQYKLGLIEEETGTKVGGREV